MGSILGSKQTSEQSSTTSGQGTSNSVQGSTSTGRATSNSNSYSGPGMSADTVLDTYYKERQGTDQWSKESAINDVMGTLRTQAYDAMKSVMPGIAKTQNTAGAYDSTTKNLLQNDASAKITSALSETALKAITDYGQLGNQATANNNQLLAGLGGVAKDTGSSTSTSTSTQTSDSSSFGVSESQYDQNSTGSGGSKGGSGLFGLFADGGKVPEQDATGGALKMFLDGSGMSRQIMDMQDMTSAAKKMMNGQWKEGAKQFAETDILSQEDKDTLYTLNAALDLYDSYTKGSSSSDTSALSGAASTVGSPAMFADGGIVGGDPMSGMMGMPDMGMFFANGGRVPLTTERLLRRADGGNVPGFGQQMQAPAMPQFVFNIGNGAPPKSEGDPGMKMLGDMITKQMPDGGEHMTTPGADGTTGGGTPPGAMSAMGSEAGGAAAGEAAGQAATEAASEAASEVAAEAATEAAGEAASEAAAEMVITAFLEDGGVVPEGFTKLFKGRGNPVPKNTLTPEQELLAAVKKYNNGGAVRSGESDVQQGGKIRGKQSPTGEDNQIIGVAGGEGIIPKDVMEVKGVPELLQKLIQTYHTPVQK